MSSPTATGAVGSSRNVRVEMCGGRGGEERWKVLEVAWEEDPAVCCRACSQLSFFGGYGVFSGWVDCRHKRGGCGLSGTQKKEHRKVGRTLRAD